MEELAWSNLPGRVLEKPRIFGYALLAGQLAGLAFLAFWCLVFLLFRHDHPWTWPIQVIGAFLLGEGALWEPSALAYVLGILVNQVVALAWAGAYGWLMISPRFPHALSSRMTAAFLLGLAAISVDVYFLLPPVIGVLHDQDFWWKHLPRTWDWVAHIAFGLVLGWFFDVFAPPRTRG